jgi:hypothetical protein
VKATKYRKGIMSKRQLSVTLGFVRDIFLITAISILAFVVLDKEIEPDIQGDEYDKVEDTTTKGEAEAIE